MLSEKVLAMTKQKSVIREIFEYGMARAREIGAENVYDFSIGNPSVPAPESVDQAIYDIMKEQNPVERHGYAPNAGILEVRETIAQYLNKRFDMDYTGANIFMTNGAAASLGILFQLLKNEEEDNIITFAPFFPEYQAYAISAGIQLEVLPANPPSFQIDFSSLEGALNEHTKAVLINSPNNPSGVVYSKETIKQLAALLEKKQQEYGHPIYIISDEPYREIVYKGFEVSYVPKFYDNTFVCYSYSKSLSLPGERIGYIAYSNKVAYAEIMLGALVQSARLLSYVCVPSMFQKVVARCVADTADLSVYAKNRERFYNALTEMGYECAQPGGAFYLFMKALEPDAGKFCEVAKKYDLLLVPSDSFGCPGYVRISYCVDPKRIEGALPLFQKLMDEYKGEN
jgi:aspartate aminotransferase